MSDKGQIAEMLRETGPAEVEDARGSGAVALRLLKANMDPQCLRTNDTLLDDEWKVFDDAIVAICRARMGGIMDLQSRGLVYNIPNGMASTVLQFQNVSDMNDAEMSMNGLTVGQFDRLDYGIGYLPLPIIHKDFFIDARSLAMTRRSGHPLDTTMAEVAAIKVAQKAETLLFQGAGSYKFGGGYLRGYEDFDYINTGSLSVHWDASAGTGTLVKTDVLAMKQKSLTAKHYGPWILYIPSVYETVMDQDYTTSTGQVTTVRQRLLMINGIVDVKVSDFMSATKVILAEVAPPTVRIVNGMTPTTVQWDTDGGLGIRFKVMTIMVPQFRADQDGNCGITVYSE